MVRKGRRRNRDKVRHPGRASREKQRSASADAEAGASELWGEDGALRAGRFVVFLLLCVVVLAVPTIFSVWTIEAARIKQLVFHLCMVAALVAIVIQIAASGRVALRWDSLHTAVAVFLALVVISALTGSVRYVGRNDLWRVSILVTLYAATVYAVRSARRVKTLAALAGVVVLLVCIYAVAQYKGHDFLSYSQDATNRVFSSVGNANMLAGYLLLMFWLMIGLALDSRSRMHKAFLAALCGLIVVCLVLTKTKASWLAFAASAGLFLIWLGLSWRFPYAVPRRVRKIVLTIIAVVALAGVALGLAIFLRLRALPDGRDIKTELESYPIVGRFSTLPDSVNVRKVFWAGALGHFRENPVFGVGAGSFQVLFPVKRPPDFRKYGVSYNTWHAHSEPIQILMEMVSWDWPRSRGSFSPSIEVRFARLPTGRGSPAGES